MKLSWTPSLSSWGPCGATKSFVKTGLIHYIALQYGLLLVWLKMHFTLAGSFVHLSWNFCKKTRMIHDIKLLQISQKYLWINIAFTKSIEELSRGIERWDEMSLQSQLQTRSFGSLPKPCSNLGQSKTTLPLQNIKKFWTVQHVTLHSCNQPTAVKYMMFFDLEISKKDTTNTIPFCVRNIPGTGWCLHIPHRHPKAPQHCRPHH